MKRSIKLLYESLLFAVHAIKVNRMRTVLSLLGITIGIFAIITVFTIIDSMEKNIRTSIASLGDDVIFVQKWPWAFSNDYPWWKYLNRPNPKLKEKEFIQKNSFTIKDAVFAVADSKSVKYKKNTLENVTIYSVSENYDLIKDFDISMGRYFSEAEEMTGKPVIVIGETIRRNLFADNTNPVDKEIKVYGRKIQVIGVFKKEGNDQFGNSLDEVVMMPLLYIKNIIDINNEQYGPYIMIKAKEGISNIEMREEIRGIMRSARSLKPSEEDDFALNETSIISKGFDGLFSTLNLVGWVIGLFAILVGGFGIANIMFVSVKERTFIIGTQMALGAKKSFILSQFLFEAVMLCLIGGSIGLFLIFIGSQLISFYTELSLSLSQYNVLRGIFISVAIGIIAGIIPAMSAARLNPVEAIRSNG